ncbi:MAG TPA: hypothetical protein VI386_03835 [Candidatus Sulfotelmatobacter sp.]
MGPYPIKFHHQQVIVAVLIAARSTGDKVRALNVDDLTIMEILRHSNVAVTRASYI